MSQIIYASNPFDLRAKMPAVPGRYTYTGELSSGPFFKEPHMQGKPGDERACRAKLWTIECRLCHQINSRRTTGMHGSRLPPHSCKGCGTNFTVKVEGNDLPNTAVFPDGVRYGLDNDHVIIIHAPHAKFGFQRSGGRNPLSPEMIDWLLDVQHVQHENGCKGNIGVVLRGKGQKCWAHPEIFVMYEDDAYRDDGKGVGTLFHRQAWKSTLHLKAKYKRGLPSNVLAKFGTRGPPRISADTLQLYSTSAYEDVVWRLRPAKYGLMHKSAIFTRKSDVPADWAHPLIDWLPDTDTGKLLYASALLIEHTKSTNQEARSMSMGRTFARVSPTALSTQSKIYATVKIIAATYSGNPLGKPILVINEQTRQFTKGLFDTRVLRFQPEAWMSARVEQHCPVVWLHHYAGSRVDRTTVGGEPAMFKGLSDELIWGISAPDGNVQQVSNRSGGKPPPLPVPIPGAW